MGFLDQIKKVYGQASKGAQSVLNNVSKEAQDLLGTLGDQDAHEVFGSADYIKKAAGYTQQKGQNLSAHTQSLLQSIQETPTPQQAPEGDDFFSHLLQSDKLNEGTKSLLASIKTPSKEGVYQDYGKKFNFEAVKQLAKDAGVSGDFLINLGNIISGPSPTTPEESIRHFLPLDELRGIVGTPISAFGEMLKGASEGKIVKPIAAGVMGAGSLTPAGAAFNAIGGTEAGKQVMGFLGEKMQVLADNVKKNLNTPDPMFPQLKPIGFDPEKHPEINDLIDTGFQALPYVLAFGALEKSGKTPTPEAVKTIMADTKWQESAGKFLDRANKEIAKGDYTRVNELLQSSAGKKFNDTLSSIYKEKISSKSDYGETNKLVKKPMEESAGKEKPFEPSGTPPPEVSTKVLPKSIQDLPTSKEAKRFILSEAEALKDTPEFKAATKKVSFDEMKSAADNLEMKPEDFKRVAESSPKTYAVVVKAMDVLAQKSEALKAAVFEFSQNSKSWDAATTEAKLAELQTLKLDYDQHFIASREIIGDVGRALVSTKVLKNLNKQIELANLDASRPFDATDIMNAAEGLAKGESLESVLKGRRQGLLDKIANIRTAGLVSDPRTHFSNIVSNTSRYLFDIPEKLLAAGIEVPSALLAGRPREVFFRELLYSLDGMTVGSVQGLKNAFKVLMGSTEEVGKSKDAVLPKGGIIDKTLINPPFKLLAAADAFQRAQWDRMGLLTEALRTAKKEKLEGAQLQARIKELIANPTAEMKAKITETSAKGVFQEKMGEVARIFSSFRNLKNPVARFIAKIVLPFVQTPANVMSQAFFERTPLAIFDKGFRDAVKTGGRARSEALARMTLGTGVTAMGVNLALSGGITGGGPEDKKERDLLYSKGWQPYSMKVGDKWYSYKKIWPLNFLFGIPATMVEKYGEHKEEDFMTQAGAYSQAMAGVILDQTFLAGLSQLTDWASGNYQGDKFLPRTAASFQPYSGFTRWLRDLNDEYLRSPSNTLEYIKDQLPEYMRNMIPGLEGTVPLKLDMWGMPIKKSSTVPGVGKTLKLDPISDELSKVGYIPGIPGNSYHSWEFSDEDYNTLLQKIGPLKKEFLTDFIQSEEYKSLTSIEDKYTALQTVTEKITDKIRDYVAPSLMIKEIGVDMDPETFLEVYDAVRKKQPLFDELTPEKKIDFFKDLFADGHP